MKQDKSKKDVKEGVVITLYKKEHGVTINWNHFNGLFGDYLFEGSEKQLTDEVKLLKKEGCSVCVTVTQGVKLPDNL